MTENTKPDAPELIQELVAPVELSMITPASVQAIEFNNQELKAYIADSLAVYSGLVVTPANLKSAKAAKVRLGKLRKAIEDKRIEIKKLSAIPYDKFALQVREIVELIDAPIEAIDRQLKAFEEAEKNKKRADLEEYYKAKIGDLAGLISFTALYDPRWMLASEKLPDTMQELGHKIDRARSGLKSIDEAGGEFLEQLRAVYLNTLDMQDVITEKVKLEKQQAQFNELKRKREEAAAAFATPAPAAYAPPPPTAPPTRPELRSILEAAYTPTPQMGGARYEAGFQPYEAGFRGGAVPAAMPPVPPLYTTVAAPFDLRIWLTVTQANALLEYLRANGIQYAQM